MNAFPSHIDSNLIRAYADGELEPEQAAALEKQVPAETLARAVEFERNLRTRVSAAMASSTPAAPAALRAAVEDALADEPAARIEPGRTGAVVIESRARRFSRANIFAVAASLLLVAGAVLFGIYGVPIDRWNQQAAVPSASEISEFASGEHDRCAFSPEARQRKITLKDSGTCCALVSDMLGLKNRQVTMFKLDQPDLHYTFMGAGECHVPNYDRSVHLMYKREAPGKTPAMASIFICAQGSASTRVQPGDWMELPVTAGCAHAVFTSTDGTVDYLLVCCDADDLEKLRAAIGEQLKRSCGRIK